jgi:hypothetical protein
MKFFHRNQCAYIALGGLMPLLTGRGERFQIDSKRGGISQNSEDPFFSFTTGHEGTVYMIGEIVKYIVENKIKKDKSLVKIGLLGYGNIGKAVRDYLSSFGFEKFKIRDARKTQVDGHEFVVIIDHAILDMDVVVSSLTTISSDIDDFLKNRYKRYPKGRLKAKIVQDEYPALFDANLLEEIGLEGLLAVSGIDEVRIGRKVYKIGRYHTTYFDELVNRQPWLHRYGQVNTYGLLQSDGVVTNYGCELQAIVEYFIRKSGDMKSQLETTGVNLERVLQFSQMAKRIGLKLKMMFQNGINEVNLREG